MVLWPAVTLVGFLMLTALVIAMGTRSTARYEAERHQAEGQATLPPHGVAVAPDAVGAAAAV